MRNAVGAVAAALAAIWALATQLPGQVGGIPGPAQVLVFGSAVLAYVLKDRIKAVTSEYLLRKIRRHDHVARLHGDALDDLGLGALRAQVTEAVRFLAPTEVPDAIRRLRVARRTVRHAEAGPEEVIHYRKRVAVGAAGNGGAPSDSYRVRDILRINVRHFLTRLDDPLDHVRYFDPDRGSFAEAELPKVYHLNLVLRVRREDPDGTRHERREHLRVVLDKTGIVRVVTVGAEGPIVTAPAPGQRRATTT